MRHIKRFVAGVLCASMLFNMNGIVTFAATNDMELQEEITTENFTEESDSDVITTQEEEEYNGTEVVAEEGVTEEEQRTESVQDIQESQPDETVSEISAPLINWMMVAEDYITSSMTQNILVDIGNEDTDVTSAYIFYRHCASGKEYTQEVTSKDGTLLTFQLDSASIAESGEYVITKLSVVSDGAPFDINLTEIGINAKFGVDVTVTSDADVLLASEDNALEMDGVVISDVEGNEISAADIGEAISDMGSDNLLKKSAKDVIVVVLDPGHGGSDNGAYGNGVVEKTANLKIAQYCKAQLEKYSGVRVYMTRESDVYVGLEERVTYAASVGADLFVSLHNNAAGSAATGSEVYYPNANYNPAVSNVGAGVSQAILNALTSLGLADRGIRTRDYSPAGGASTTDYYPDGSVSDYYSVIRNSKLHGFPGIIVEHAFVSNYSDAVNYLTSESSLAALGIADADAIASYFGLPSATETTYQGIEYGDVYNFEYYMKKNRDLREIYADDEAGALKHFVEHGMMEKRVASEEFNVNYYMNRYVSLRNKFGSDYKKYYLHYINSGKKEGRDGKTYCERQGTVTYYNGVDYSAVYDFEYYEEKYASIKRTFGEDDIATIQHFVTRGMKNGNQASEEFNVRYYKNRYPSLRARFGNDLVKYYNHYINYGQKKKLNARTYSDLIGYVTVYKGVDYSAVYDFNYYQKKYSSIRKTFGDDDVATLAHFVNKGMKNGNQASASFDVKSYARKYYDLRKLYKNNLKSYYIHYIKNGKQEGRIATGTTAMQGGLKVYQGVNYSAVYNVGFYASKYPSLYNKYGFDDEAYIKHFVKYGMKEGRQGSSEFNVQYYKNRYADLRSLYGYDLVKYYLHYINSGKREGRNGKTYSDLVGYVTTYNGVDYSAVYDFNYYQDKYSSIRKAYGDDDIATLEHFVKRGMRNGNQAISTFDVTSYRYANPDLRKAFRSNLTQYYMHYIESGKNEKRKTTGVTTLQKPWTVYEGVDYSAEYNFWTFRETYPFLAEKYGMDDYGLLEYYVTVFSKLTPVAGKATTNVSQMVKYYNAKASYPEFYQASDAPNIQTFCQIVYEESVAEGIDPAVTFCQAMKETGFLRFGGDVSITQYNFAGLGATGGVPGESFPSVRHGIRAQVQHLKAYANNASLNNACVDTRFSYVSRGSAPYVEWLGIHENPYGRGWAAAVNYGYSLKRDYMMNLYGY